MWVRAEAHFRMRIAGISALLTVALVGLAADGIQAPYASVRPVLDALADRLPIQLKDVDELKWIAWAGREDKAIRGRLEQGDLDSMVNLLLFGTSFTKQPPIQVREMIEGSQNTVVQLRLRDFLAGLQAPANNDRLTFLRTLLRSKGMDVTTADGYQKAGVFVLENLGRALKEQIKFAQSIEDAQRQNDPTLEFVERSRLFRDRGVSLDTSILPNFGIEETLRDLKSRGLLREGKLRRVAVIGPGLDFADKESGYDFYPQQTLQPFALYDSLVRLGLAESGKIEVSVFDISARVLDHLRRARERAKAGTGYVAQLPRDPAHQWVAPAVRYWRAFGDRIGMAVPSTQPPAILQGLEMRAVRIRPAAVLACVPTDLNIVFERLEMPPTDRFDLVVATNVFVYYDTLEQTLALQNVSTMLKTDGFLLSNNELLRLPQTSMQSAGYTTVRYGQGASAGDHFVWYRRQ